MFVGIDPEETRDVFILSDPAFCIPPEKRESIEEKYLESLDPDIVRAFIRPGKEPSVFTIGPLYFRRRQRIRMGIVRRAQMQGKGLAAADLDASSVLIETVRWGVRGWKNFADHTGQEVKAKVIQHSSLAVVEHELAEESLALLGGRDLFDDLCVMINGLNSLTEDEVKNSEPPSESRNTGGAAINAKTRSSKRRAAKARQE